mmetsp:Transcript_72046/g.114816  ORF Transcript_72046/g.114816 Transcript_72046/m.114816 type:complete len:200 (+) Transcript_72046:329-928(+)
MIQPQRNRVRVQPKHRQICLVWRQPGSRLYGLRIIRLHGQRNRRQLGRRLNLHRCRRNGLRFGRPIIQRLNRHPILLTICRRLQRIQMMMMLRRCLYRQVIQLRSRRRNQQDHRYSTCSVQCVWRISMKTETRLLIRIPMSTEDTWRLHCHQRMYSLRLRRVWQLIFWGVCSTKIRSRIWCTRMEMLVGMLLRQSPIIR